MKKLGKRIYLLIARAKNVEGTCDPNEIFFFFEEELRLTDDDQLLWNFLEWCHRENKIFGSGNYEERFQEFLTKNPIQ
jgi:hypothetical protein